MPSKRRAEAKFTLAAPYHLSPQSRPSSLPPPYQVPVYRQGEGREEVGRSNDFGTADEHVCRPAAMSALFSLALFLPSLALVFMNEEQSSCKAFLHFPRQAFPRLYVRSNTHAFAQRLSVRQEERRTCGQFELQAVASAEIVGPRTAISRTPLSDDGHIGLPFLNVFINTKIFPV